MIGPVSQLRMDCWEYISNLTFIIHSREFKLFQVVQIPDIVFLYVLTKAVQQGGFRIFFLK